MSAHLAVDRSGLQLLNGGRLGGPSGQPRRYDRMASSATSKDSEISVYATAAASVTKWLLRAVG